MQRKDDDRETKHPIEMTTDEALDYVFGSELADKLRQEVQEDDPDDCEAD
jgi:hypothetical protein